MQYEGIVDVADLRWDTLISSWKQFQRTYYGPNTLEEFARMVVKFPEPFRVVTRARARHYVSILDDNKAENFREYYRNK